MARPVRYMGVGSSFRCQRICRRVLSAALLTPAVHFIAGVAKARGARRKGASKEGRRNEETAEFYPFIRRVERQIREEARRLRQGEAGLAGAVDAAVSGRQMLDFDTLAFAQGGHFMSNKTCNLPQGSYRSAKKGYEE
eukprot:scaffold85086_cov45-Prasinocladus_malaysianus.AAC.1